MTEATSQQAVEPNEPTLDDVYKSVETEFQPEPKAAPTPPAPAPAPQEPSIPDPYDTENFKAYLVNQAKGNTALQQSVQQLVGYLTQQQMKEAQAQLRTDIDKAVENVNAIVGHPKPKVIEAMLDAKAREDVRFKAIFDNRQKNPAAWANACKAVAKEFASDLSVKVDPSLVRSQEARRISQQAMATTDGPRSDQEEWESMSPAEQQAKMERMLNGQE